MALPLNKVKQLYGLVWEFSPLISEQGVRNFVNDLGNFIQNPAGYRLIKVEEYEELIKRAKKVENVH